MPIIIDQFKDNSRFIVFQLSAIGSFPLTLTINDSLNYLISASESFSLQKPYEIIETHLEKRINLLSITDGTNTVNFSSNIHEESDEIQIFPDFQIPIKNKLWNKFKKLKTEPSSVSISTRIRSEKLVNLGLLANPTINWNIDYQISFLMR